MALSIGELAKATGETVKTLRHWTGHGLLEAERGENGYRYYWADMTRRIAFICGAQALGFTLSEIQDILVLRASGLAPCEHVKAGLESHLETVRPRIAQLEALESDLQERLAWAEAYPEPECQVDGCIYVALVPRIIHDSG